MNYNRPRYENWALKLLTALFLMAVGGFANQFWNIPRQQGQMYILEKRMEAMEARMNTLEQQHMTMMSQLDRLQRVHETEK